MKNNFKNKKINIQKNTGGYAVLELLFYIAFFAVLTLVVIDAMIVMSKSFQETKIQTELMQGGAIMERISREIRAAYDINTINTNNLILNTKDDSGVDKTMEFSLSSSDLRLLENGALTGNLNTSNIDITSLVFTQITTAKGKAVRVILSIKSSNDASARIEDFNDTVVLRGSY